MNKSYLIAGGIAAAAVLWVASGAIFSSGPDTELSAIEQANLNQPEGLQRVQVMRSTAQPRVRQIKVAGRTEASRQITLRAETEGVVTEIVVPRGSAVKQGDALVRLAVEDRQARLKKAEAQLAKRELEFRAAENLSKKSFTSEVSLANAKAEMESARADLETAQLELARTVIRAPFDGYFNRNHVEVGDYLRVGDDVAAMVDLDPLLVKAELAELAVSQVTLGNLAKAELIDGREVSGLITFVSNMASPETRTFTVEVSIDNPDRALVDGMTATLHLPAQEVMTHSVPPAALTLDDSGAVGIKLVDSQGRVSFAPVSTASATAESVWLVGLPATVDIITVGQEFVRIGQEVEAVMTPPSDAGLLGSLPPNSGDRTRLAQSEGRIP